MDEILKRKSINLAKYLSDCGIVFGKMARGSGATPEGKRVCNVTLYFPLRVDSAALPPECALSPFDFLMKEMQPSAIKMI